MSALPPKADGAERDRHVRFVPLAEVKAMHQRPFPVMTFGGTSSLIGSQSDWPR
jgi:hypothetical protein